MKKFAKFTAFFAAVVAVFAVFAFSACEQSDGVEVNLVHKSEKLVVIEATATGGSLKDALAVLKEEGMLDYSGSEGDFGFYLESLGGYTPDSSQNEYWAIYTTLGEYEGAEYSNTEYGTYEYDGKVCASASYGVSGILLVEGEIYLFTVESW